MTDANANTLALSTKYLSQLKAPTITSVIRTNNKTLRVDYMADTDHGSSGSPLIAVGSKTVVALHHQGGCPNHAIPSNLLVQKLRNTGEENDGLAK